METAVMSMEVATSVEQLTGQLLTDFEDISGQGPAGPSTTSPSSPAVNVADTKMEEDEPTSDSVVRPSPAASSTGTAGQGSSSPDGGPLVIDLSDDDEEEYSKENIEKAPAKKLTGLMSTLTNETTADLLAKIKLAVTSLPREELQEMFCAKIGEFAEMDKQYRKLEMKFGNFLVYNDKVVRKVALLEKQAHDMAKTMLNVTECMTRNPNNVQKVFTPIKFLRTIGVQCRTDPMPRLKQPLGTSKSMNTPPPPLAPTTKVTVDTGTNMPNGVIQPTNTNATTFTPQKRLNKTTVDVGGMIDQIQPGLPPPKMRRPGPASRIGVNSAQIQIQPKPQQSLGVNRDVLGLTNGVVATNGATNANGLVDLGGLTRSSPMCRKSNVPEVQCAGSPMCRKSNVPEVQCAGSPMCRESNVPEVQCAGSPMCRESPVLVNQNGLQYRLGKLPPGIQIGTSSAGGATQYQVVSSQGQGRSVLVQQNPVHPGVAGQIVQRQASPNQQSIVIRNGEPVSVARQFGPRISATDSNSTGLSPGQILVRYTNGQNQLVSTPLPKFVLPELPLMSPQPNKPKQSPPRTTLTLKEQGGGIVLSWTHIMNSTYAEIQSYQIYACQEPVHNYPGKTLSTPMWKRVGDVKALPLPMAVGATISKFTDESRYHFIVRGVDVYNRTGVFCECVNILLKKKLK